MRVFVAAVFPDETINKLSSWLLPFMEEHQGLKWVKSEKLHLTLRYFGNIEDGKIEQISQLISEWQPNDIDFTLEKSGTFGRRNKLPAIYWIGGTFGVCFDVLAEELGRIKDEKGETIGKKFVPHLTVARQKRYLTKMELPNPPAISGKMSEVVIFNSTLTQKGPIYKAIERFRLEQSYKGE